MAGNKETIDNPKAGDVWGYEGYGLEGHEGEYMFAVAFCIDGGPLRCAATTFDGQKPDDVRERAFDNCLQSVQTTWLLTTPSFMEGSFNVTPYAGQGSRMLAGPRMTA